MDRLRAFVASPRFRLFADACLLTAGTFAACVAVGGGLVQLLGLVGGPVANVVQALLGPIFTFAALFVGPGAAWVLRGRRLSGAAVIGALFGLVAMVAVLGILIAGVLTIARPIVGAEAPTAIALASIFGVAVIAIVAVSLTDAIRDLRGARASTRLDALRLAAAAAIVLFLAAMGVAMVVAPGTDILEALPIMIVFALAGGMMTAGAGAADRGAAHSGTGDAAPSA